MPLVLEASYIPKMKLFVSILFLLIPFALKGQSGTIKLSEDLELIPLNDHTYIHKSFTNSEQFGRFSSNGLIYIQNGEALVADTPSDTLITNLLIDWMLEQELQIKAVVVNHHHVDALGGLAAFHKLGVPSYGFTKTKLLADSLGFTSPTNTFETFGNIEMGKNSVFFYFFGEGHSIDNTVLWLPIDNILFGGCMIKSLGSGKGNLEDANIQEWSNTVMKVREHLPQIEVVIPGHGKHGGVELLDFTIKMFKNHK